VRKRKPGREKPGRQERNRVEVRTEVDRDVVNMQYSRKTGEVEKNRKEIDRDEVAKD
jgi:hypothetical protein